jgi:NAD(P)-dependent dehydrogenase (short-subunit alcohol dehydrogenase family)
MTSSSKFVLDLSGKTVVVTGGNRGIGLALSEGVAKAGANVAIIFKCAPLFLQFLIERSNRLTGRPRTHTKPPRRSPSNTA